MYITFITLDVNPCIATIGNAKPNRFLFGLPGINDKSPSVI